MGIWYCAMRAALLLAALLQLTACAGFVPFQSPDKVIIRAGSLRDIEYPVEDYAGRFVRYAAFATLAYGENGEDGYRWDKEVLPFAPAAPQWIKGWKRVAVQEGPLPCPDAKPCLLLGGLGFQIWRHKRCGGEVVIAFRGTNFHELDDWQSNLHWLTRLTALRDQYEQVRAHIGWIVDKVVGNCPNTEVVAVGHSLGGGLAQLAAYTDRRIRSVYAFDPSFVTGSSDHPVQSAINSRGHRVERVYEHGEILAYLRFLQRQFDPQSVCDPQIRTVRFNLGRGSILAQHSMSALTVNLIRVSGSPGQWRSAKKNSLPDAPETDPVTGRCRVMHLAYG